MCVFRNEYSEGGKREGESELRDKEQAELGSPARLCLFPSLSPVAGPAAWLLPPGPAPASVYGLKACDLKAECWRPSDEWFSMNGSFINFTHC